jgi:hypothetical protein
MIMATRLWDDGIPLNISNITVHEAIYILVIPRRIMTKWGYKSLMPSPTLHAIFPPCPP